MVIAIIAVNDIVQAIPCTFRGAGAKVEVLDVAGHDVVDGGDDFVGTFASDFLDQISEVVDVVSVVAGSASHGVITPVTIENVVTTSAVQGIDTETAIERVCTRCAFNSEWFEVVGIYGGY